MLKFLHRDPVLSGRLANVQGWTISRVCAPPLFLRSLFFLHFFVPLLLLFFAIVVSFSAMVPLLLFVSIFCHVQAGVLVAKDKVGHRNDDTVSGTNLDPGFVDQNLTKHERTRRSCPSCACSGCVSACRCGNACSSYSCQRYNGGPSPPYRAPPPPYRAPPPPYRAPPPPYRAPPPSPYIRNRVDTCRYAKDRECVSVVSIMAHIVLWSHPSPPIYSSGPIDIYSRVYNNNAEMKCFVCFLVWLYKNEGRAQLLQLGYRLYRLQQLPSAAAFAAANV